MSSSLSRVLCVVLAVITPISIAAKPPTSLWPVEACTDKSFSIPSWLVSDFAASDKISFTLTNRVLELSSSISCSRDGGSCTGASNDDLKVAAQPGEGSVKITVEDAWTCRDKKTLEGEPKVIHFEAGGNTTISLDCESDGEGCSSTHDVDLVKGFLTEPLYLEMGPPARGAASSNSTTCRAETAPPEWEVVNIEYYNNTYSNYWTGPTRGRGINMDIRNKASGDFAQCRIIFTLDPFETAKTRRGQCWRSAYQSGQQPAGPGQLWTEFDFEEETHTITLNQRWYCVEPVSLKTTTVNGVVTAVLPLNCTTYDYGLREGVRDVRIQCVNSSAQITGKVDSREDTPAFAYQDPYPTTDGCTVKSVVTPYFTVGEAQLNITIDNGSEEKAVADSWPAKLSFEMYTIDEYLVFPSQQIEVSDVPGGPGSQAWHNCSNFAGYRLPACRWRYDYATDEIEVHQEWKCLDKGDNHIIEFNGTGSGTLPDRRCSEKDGVRVCEFGKTITIEPQEFNFYNGDE
ncbi:hypothetical protein F5Y04DRAFT_168020 [Hypomontagnella monticulosa]|nr:hypothetical protein F5Y04DRAFT_168020 [Hypomontagnella monticulosa]